MPPSEQMHVYAIRHALPSDPARSLLDRCHDHVLRQLYTHNIQTHCASVSRPNEQQFTAECQRIETRNRRKQEQQVKEERVCGHWVKRGKEWMGLDLRCRMHARLVIQKRY